METFYENKTILVTGGTGFIGKNLINKLLKLNVKHIIIFDRTIKYKFKNVTNITYINGNLLTDIDIINQYNFDIMFHLAANVDTTCNDHDNMIKTNFNSFYKLIQICEIKNAKLIYASSAAVYGNSESPNCVNQGETPLNIYGQSKLMMDSYLKNNKDTIKIPVIGIRFFNVYGPGELHKKNNMMSMIGQMIINIKNNENIKLFEFGEQKRDFVYIDDIVYCNLLAGMHNISNIYNCGYGQSVDFNLIYNIIYNKYNNDSQIIYIPNIYKFFQLNTCADISATTYYINYIPKFNITDGIEKYIDDFNIFNIN